MRRRQPLVQSYVAMQATISAGAYGDNFRDAFDIVASVPVVGEFAWPHEIYDQSRVDLWRYWPNGFPGGTSTYYMAGAQSAAANWINLYNPDDVATSLAWKGSNLVKHYLNQWDPELPDLPGVGDDVIWAYLLAQLSFDINNQLWRLLPPVEVWPNRYVVEYDEVNGHSYYRLPRSSDDDLGTDPALPLTTLLTDPMNPTLPGPLAYEIMAFMSQSNAAPLGTNARNGTPFNFANQDLINLGLSGESTSIY